jgi:HK97 family phage major capsid protein
MLADIVRVPLKTRIMILSGGVTGYGIAQANVKPISSLSLAADTIDPRKAVATVVISDELAKFATPAAEKLFNAELRKGVAAATDSVFLSGLAVGVTPSASAGSSAANVLTDLQTLLAAVTTGPNSRLYFIIDAANAKKLVTKINSGGAMAFPGMGINGGEILPGVTAVVTDQLGANTAMLVDATGIIGETSNVDLKMARHSTLQFNTEPDSPPSALTGLVSLWQYNLRALIAERWFGFEKARSTAVAMLSGVNY